MYLYPSVYLNANDRDPKKNGYVTSSVIQVGIEIGVKMISAADGRSTPSGATLPHFTNERFVGEEEKRGWRPPSFARRKTLSSHEYGEMNERMKGAETGYRGLKN